MDDNLHLPEDHPVTRELGEVILNALSRNPLFVSAALPLRVFPPLFNCYRGGQSFGNHVDNAIRESRTNGSTVRTDLSASTPSSCRRGTWCYIPHRACTRSRP